MKHKIYILNRSGHAPVAEWTPTNQVEIKTAEEVFGDLQRRNFRMFDGSNPQKEDQELLTEFDPKAKEIVAFGPSQGG